MKAKDPQGVIENDLTSLENWEVAAKANSYWHENETTCDVCLSKLTGRHMIDGKLAGLLEFALMCPKCHQLNGGEFGEGKGQLYTKVESGKWLMTFGFIKNQLLKKDKTNEKQDTIDIKTNRNNGIPKSDEQIIREVLILKYKEKQLAYNENIFDFLEVSKKWISKALLFDLTSYQRKGIKTWTYENNYHYEYDSILACNWRLNEEILKKLLKFQPINFWILYLNSELYKKSINNLESFPSCSDFLQKSEWQINFPTNEWQFYLKVTQKIFEKVEKEKVVEKLKEEKLSLLLISKKDIYSRIEINMLNVLLYSVLFNLDFIELTKICIFMSHLIFIIEEGEDAANKRSDNHIVQMWYENGNWNLIINHYASIFNAEKNKTQLSKFNEYLNLILKEKDIKLLPFNIIQTHIGNPDKINNERVRTNINSARIGENNDPIFNRT
jgi:hypothetical protein